MSSYLTLVSALSLCDHFLVRPRVHPIASSSEISEFADEVRRIFLELGRTFGVESPVGECSPTIDVYETDETIEITVDLPGVSGAAVRILAKGDSLLIAGEKRAAHRDAESSFHLVERDYGRFARGVRLGCACNATRARAALRNGELRISVPKIVDRRGTVIPIKVAAGEAG